MESKTPPNAWNKLLELYDVARKIHDAFPLSPDLDITPEEIVAREEALRGEFTTLCTHLLAMAVAEIRMKGLHEKSHDPDVEEVTINDTACIAVSFLFFPRKKGGLREIIEIIRSLFRRNPDAGPVDLFNYFKAVVSRNLSQSAKQKARFENPWYYCIARCVDFHIRSRLRYTMEDRIVIDLESRKAGNPSRLASSEEILAFCNRFSPTPKKPGSAVDVIFDCLEESDQFDSRLDKQELYLAVYKLMTPHMTVEYPRSSIPTPDESYLVGKLHAVAYDLLGEIVESYNWRKIRDPDIQAAYMIAGEDILMDLIYFGERKNSQYEYLAAHIEGLTREKWRELMGSFQHFVKVLEQKWAERLREL